MNDSTLQRARHSLNGTWKFRLDPCEKGLSETWYSQPGLFEREIAVPGTIQQQDVAYGSRFDGKRTPGAHESFNDLDPEFPITRSEYRGAAWYMREFAAPAFHGGETVWLCLDGVHPSAMLWIDGRPAGEHRAGPLERCRLDITALVAPLRTHRLAVMISEEGRLLQGVVKWPYFSGIYKDAYLEVTKGAQVREIFVRTDIETGDAAAEVILSGPADGGVLSCEIVDSGGRSVAAAETRCSGGAVQYALPMRVPDHKLWDPDSPCLYTGIVRLAAGPEYLDERTARFGFRKLSREGKQLLLNGRPVFLRGTGFGGTFGFPDPGPKAYEWYRKVVARAKEYGFNYLRWHTCSMEPALLDAADELGLMIQSELFSVFYETEEERALTGEQCGLMLRRNRNHPSVACFVMGNEHDGTNPVFIGFRDSLCRMARELSPDTLVMDSDGIASAGADHKCSDIACVGLGAGIGSVLDMSPGIEDLVRKYDKPYMIHEFGYPESFPETRDIPKYVGGLRPFWLEHTLKAARAAKADALLPAYVANSRRLHFTIVKKAVEDARKVDGLGGYGHWGFHDFVHESIGLVDLFLDDKGGSAAEFRKVNGEIVLAMTPACDRYTGYQDEPYEFELHLSNHSGGALYGKRLKWELLVDGRAVSSGGRTFAAKSFGVTPLGRCSVSGPDAGEPYSAVLRAYVQDTGISNDWTVWLFPRIDTPSYPAPVRYFSGGWQTSGRFKTFCPAFRGVSEAALWEMEPGALLVTAVMTAAVSDYLRRGGSVLLLPVYYTNGGCGLPMLPSSFGPMPSFAGSTGGCGTVVSDHPALKGFPTESFCDYQWFDLIGGERIPHVCAPFHYSTPAVYDLGKWPAEIRPIIRSIPNWKRCDNRAYLFEARVGEGKLLASSMRVFENMFTNPECAWLLDAMLRYAAGMDFRPEASVTHEQFERIREPVSLACL